MKASLLIYGIGGITSYQKLPQHSRTYLAYLKRHTRYQYIIIFKLIPKNVFLKSAPIYMSAVLDLSGKEKEKESILSSNLNKLLGLDVNQNIYHNFRKMRLTLTFQSISLTNKPLIYYKVFQSSE